jgi:hypothetical protein
VRLATSIQMGVTAAAVGVILWRVPLEAMWSVLTDMQAIWLLPALVPISAMLTVRWIRWHTLLCAGGVRSSEITSARSLMGGFALGAVIPGRLG